MDFTSIKFKCCTYCRCERSRPLLESLSLFKNKILQNLIEISILILFKQNERYLYQRDPAWFLLLINAINEKDFTNFFQNLPSLFFARNRNFEIKSSQFLDSLFKKFNGRKFNILEHLTTTTIWFFYKKFSKFVFFFCKKILKKIEEKSKNVSLCLIQKFFS